MTVYHLGKWVWDPQGLNGLGVWGPPQPGAIGAIDLRAHDECAIHGGTQGYGFFAYPNAISGDPNLQAMASDPQELIGSVRRNAMQNALGVTLTAPRFQGIVSQLFLDPTCIDVSGATKRKPLMPNGRKELQLYIDQLLSTQILDPADPLWAVIRGQMRADFRKLRLAAGAGEFDISVVRKVLGFWMKHWGVSDPTEFQLSGDPVIDPLDPATTLTDNFNRANGSLGTASGGFSWNNTIGTFVVDTNSAMSNIGASESIARAEQDLSSSDHYAQVTCTLGPGTATDDNHGVLTRYSTAATTYYLWAWLKSQGHHQIYKRVAGTYTNLPPNGTATTASVGDVLKFSVSGTTLTGYKNGVSDLSITDSAISTGVRCGMYLYTAIAKQNALDDWSASDLGGGATVFSRYYYDMISARMGM